MLQIHIENLSGPFLCVWISAFRPLSPTLREPDAVPSEPIELVKGYVAGMAFELAYRYLNCISLSLGFRWPGKMRSRQARL